MRSHLLCSFALLCAIPLSPAQQDPELVKKERDLQRSVDRLRTDLMDARTRLIENVKVNGVALDPKAVLRACVYLTGGKLVETKVADFFILEELERQVGQGRNPKDFVVSDEEVMAEIEKVRQDFEAKNPTVDFWEVVRSNYGLSKETYILQRKQAIRFDRVFFPGQPKDWPQITKEAILQNAQEQDGALFMEQIEKATEGLDEHGQPKKLPEIWIQMMRQFVQKGLRNWSDVKYASHGLPPEIVLSVNGRDWPTAEAYDFVKEGIYVQDLERAMQEVVVHEALKQELVRAGVYISDEEFHNRYEVYRKPFDSTPFTVELIATKFRGFPCLEAYRSRWRLISSYSDLIKDEFDNAHLQAHADKFGAFFADGQVSIDLIPFQAKDTSSGGWLPDGMAKAKERCEAVFAKLEAKQISFDDAMGKHGEYFVNDELRGRLGFKPLNQVRQQLRESEFTQMLDGYSIATFLFFEAEVGKTFGPLQGADCWYIARVNARTPARRRVDVTVEKDRELVREDYLNHRFMEWAGGVIAKMKVE